jgi:hypothetical protein
MTPVEIEMVKSEKPFLMLSEEYRKIFMSIMDHKYKRAERKICQYLIESYEKAHPPQNKNLNNESTLEGEHMTVEVIKEKLYLKTLVKVQKL